MFVGTQDKKNFTISLWTTQWLQGISTGECLHIPSPKLDNCAANFMENLLS